MPKYCTDLLLGGAKVWVTRDLPPDLLRQAYYAESAMMKTKILRRVGQRHRRCRQYTARSEGWKVSREPRSERHLLCKWDMSDDVLLTMVFYVSISREPE